MTRRKACLVGVGQSEFTRWGGIKDRSQFQITAQAIVSAIRDAGMQPADVDGLASFSDDANSAPLMAVALGLPKLRWSSMVWGGGGGGSMGGLAQACAAVESGQAEAVAVYRGLCQGQGRRFGKFSAVRPGASFVNPFGLFSPPSMLALLVRRFMHLYPITELHLAEVALNARANANRNPNAVMHDKPLTLEQYLDGRWIAEPLRLYDCCLETDGACAVVVTTRERAADLQQPVIEVLSSIHGGGPQWGHGPLASHNMPDADYASTNGRGLARDLYAAAGVAPADIDVAQIYDHFSGLVLMALEEYGFCGRGESGAFVESGAIRRDSGKLPINTSGGQLSEAYVHGMNLLIEGVRQLRGTSTSQVPDARVCLVTGGLGVSPTSAAILGRV
ncbi:thiolase C-terminal domain-containing protein [Ramlibacter algicola]|uniref:Acetyl-CoA acetyltransferase n=1 Tax=Ramlibacter algicola TaxID=2795217 RepID=A0A934Q138_9BURK|nr:acetyl-CoA acetyltransferase [Ramlibacter algicola]MBK0392556.1 acetyl-CoA acetyltransferase [Ramlibacter algicola]